jgi:flagellar basal body rod protein FlgB
LYAAEQRISVAADNIANVNTPNFRAKDVVQISQDTGGVSTRVVDRSPATVTVATSEGTSEQRPNVSLEQELIQSQTASYDYQANLKVLKTERDMTKSLLDIQA